MHRVAIDKVLFNSYTFYICTLSFKLNTEEKEVAICIKRVFVSYFTTNMSAL